MWKVFLVISAFVLGGANYFAWVNKRTKETTVANVAAEKATLAAREKSVKEKKAELVALDQSILKFEGEAEKLVTEKIDLDAKVAEAKSNQKMLEAKKVSTEEELKKIKETADNSAAVTAIQDEIVQKRTQIEEAELEIVQKQGAAAAAKVEEDRLAKVASELKALRVDQDAGIIRGEFQSNVKRAFNKWGFVVINGGNDQGVVDHAQLDVYRRGQPICKLLVTSVDPSEAVADIIPGSLAAGQTVQTGDMVVKTIRGTAAAVKPAAAAPSAGTPANPATPPPAAKPAAGSADPFGGSGMAAPAPAPAPKPAADPDPFGSTPAPSKPKKPEDPDPFKQ